MQSGARRDGVGRAAHRRLVRNGRSCSRGRTLRSVRLGTSELRIYRPRRPAQCSRSEIVRISELITSCRLVKSSRFSNACVTQECTYCRAFRLTQSVDGGFSGGAVFWWEGRLSGVVSGDSFGHTYAATLWPLCRMECHYPDIEGPRAASHTVGDWFNRGVLRSPDWKSVKNRPGVEPDDRGKPRPVLLPA